MLQPLSCCSGFNPGLQSTKLSFSHSSPPPKIPAWALHNPSVPDLHSLWSPFFSPPSLCCCQSKPLLTDVGCCNALLSIHQILKSLFFCRENANYWRFPCEVCWWQESLTGCRSFAYIWSFIGKGLSSYMHQDTASLVFLLWMLFCSHLNNHLCFLSKKALSRKNGEQLGARDSSVENTRSLELLFCRDVHGVSRMMLIK